MTPDLTRAAAARRELIERLKLMFPAETEESLADTVEGLSDFNEVALATMRVAIEREAMGNAIAEMKKTLHEREIRLCTGAQKIRNVVLQAMLEAGLTKINGADMTLSVGTGRGSTLIVDETLIPDQFVELQRRIFKRELGEALRRGEQVPGATLSNPAPFLSVRRT